MKVVIYEDERGEWRWRVRANNGRIIADSGEGYKTKGNCRRAWNRFLELMVMEDRLLFSHSYILRWLIENVLTDHQLDIIPPKCEHSLRYFFPPKED
jgi:uncharacterized protein YegP (UPF0339 family)